MSVEAVSLPLTYEDLEQISDELHRYEILQGVLIVSANPAPVHARISTRLSRRLEEHIEERHLGTFFGTPVDVRIMRHDIVGPDCCFVSRDREAIITNRLIEGAPDLVIEIQSPSTKRDDRTRKMALYAGGGVREHWLVDPQTRSVRVLLFADGITSVLPIEDEIIPSRVLPELRLTLGDVFPAGQ